MTTDVNLYPIYEQASRANPQPIYNQMRADHPIWKSISPFDHNVWFITRYEDVINALKDPRLVRDARKHLPSDMVARYMPVEQDPTFAMINQQMLNMDPPDHTRLRGLVHKGFTPKRVRDLEPRIEALAQNFLDEMMTQSEADLIESFAFPFPITVIAEMIGVEPERREDFRRWTKALLFNANEAEGRMAVMELVQHVNELIEQRRQADTGDILSALVRLEEDGDTLSHPELMSMVFLLLVAGHETTVNLIGNGMLLLMQHPEQMAKLKANWDLLPSAIEEIVRYNGPVESALIRFAAEDITIDGVTIPQGDLVRISLLGANRDPNVFDNPDVFDIEREHNPHVGFGHGIHYCMGAPLARMEGMIAIKKLLEQAPDIQLATDVESLEWSENLLLHGLKALPVKW